MEALLRHASSELKAALDEATLAIDTLGGGSNLSYKLTLIQNALCITHCFLDYDKAGINAANRAKAEGLISDADLNFARCDGLSESEMEDLYDPPVYESVLLNKHRVSLQCPKFKGGKKWSDRIADTFKAQGKHWDDKVEMEVKREVAEAVEQNPAVAINQHKRPVFDALVTALKQRLTEDA